MVHANYYVPDYAVFFVDFGDSAPLHFNYSMFHPHCKRPRFVTYRKADKITVLHNLFNMFLDNGEGNNRFGNQL
jgi:hypothetical protein